MDAQDIRQKQICTVLMSLKVNVWFEQLSSAQPELSQVASTYVVKNGFFAKLCVTCCIYTWTELSGKSSRYKKTKHKNFERLSETLESHWYKMKPLHVFAKNIWSYRSLLNIYGLSHSFKVILNKNWSQFCNSRSHYVSESRIIWHIIANDWLLPSF